MKKVSPKKVRKQVAAAALPQVMYFQCPRKGHLQVEEFNLHWKNNDTGEIEFDSGPLCRQCYIEDYTERYATHRIAPPKRGKKDKPS